MKKPGKSLLFSVLALTLTGCIMPWEKDDETNHYRSYEPITGKFVLHDWANKRQEYHDTYFEFDGSKDHYYMKYYENGELKKEGKIAKIISKTDELGKWTNNLHINVETNGNSNDHISTYTESFAPLNQFRILEEYRRFDERYYLSELPYALGTYVREGAEYKAETYHTNEYDCLVPSDKRINVAFDGTFKMDDDHYFYFLSPKGWILPDEYGYFYDSYFQYYAPGLEKPIEGFADGWLTENHGYQINLKLNRNSVNDWKYPDQKLYLGYYYYDAQGIIDYKYGTVDYSDSVVKEFTFEKISRGWSEEEWNKYVAGKEDLPDPVQYGFVGGTYKNAAIES